MKTHEILHPIVRHKLDLLRDETLRSKEFRAVAHEFSMLLCYEALGGLAMTFRAIEHWQGRLCVKTLQEPLPSFCPILRAGLGVLEARYH